LLFFTLSSLSLGNTKNKILYLYFIVIACLTASQKKRARKKMNKAEGERPPPPLKLYSKKKSDVKRVTDAVESLAKTIFKDSLNLISPFRRKVREKNVKQEYPVGHILRMKIKTQYDFDLAFNHFLQESCHEEIKGESTESGKRNRGAEKFKARVREAFFEKAEKADAAFEKRINENKTPEDVDCDVICSDKSGNPLLLRFKNAFPKDYENASEIATITVKNLQEKAKQLKKLQNAHATNVLQSSWDTEAVKVGRKSVHFSHLSGNFLKKKDRNADNEMEIHLERNIFNFARMRLTSKFIPDSARYGDDGFVCLTSVPNQEIQGFHGDFNTYIQNKYVLHKNNVSSNKKSLLIATQDDTKLWYLKESLDEILEYEEGRTRMSQNMPQPTIKKASVEAKFVTANAGDVLLWGPDLIHAGDGYRKGGKGGTTAQQERARFFVYFSYDGEKETTPRTSEGLSVEERDKGIRSSVAVGFFLPEGVTVEIPDEHKINKKEKKGTSKSKKRRR